MRTETLPTVLRTGKSESVTLFYENFYQIMLNLAHYLTTSNIFVDLIVTFLFQAVAAFYLRAKSVQRVSSPSFG